jgi:broad specificity phosphatase PhoE
MAEIGQDEQPELQYQLMKVRPALLVVVRHGQSLRNTFDLHRGVDEIPTAALEIPDHLIPLTDEGERQAAATGDGLGRDFGRFDYVFHSPWLRTTQTAELIERRLPERAKMRRSVFLTEQTFGELDSALWPREMDRYLAARRRFEMRREIAGRFYSRPPDGESWADVCLRTHQFLGSIFRPETRDAKVLVVTHGVTQQTFRYHLEHPTEDELVEEYERDRSRNCGAGAYAWTPEPGWRLLFWNKVYYDG